MMGINEGPNVEELLRKAFRSEHHPLREADMIGLIAIELVVIADHVEEHGGRFVGNPGEAPARCRLVGDQRTSGERVDGGGYGARGVKAVHLVGQIPLDFHALGR